MKNVSEISKESRQFEMGGATCIVSSHSRCPQNYDVMTLYVI